MSDHGSSEVRMPLSPISDNNIRRRLRDDVLQLGPRKKAFVNVTCLYYPLILNVFPAVLLIPLSTLVATLAEQFMRYATLTDSLQMGSFAWAILQMILRSHLLWSTFV